MSEWEYHWEFWQCMMAEAPVHASAEQVAGLVSAVATERENIRQLEKRVRRRQRWLDRHSGRGRLWA
jgi:hypothetical protein